MDKRGYRFTYRSSVPNYALVKDKFKYLDYRTACRLRGPIYTVLIKQLYEDNCTITAKFFQCFILKERRLIDQLLISRSLTEIPHYLIHIVDNLRDAERADNTKTLDGMFHCLIKMNETLYLVDMLTEFYDWFVADIYHVLVSITDEHPSIDTRALQVKSRIYCGYARYLSKEAYKYPDCSKYFHKSLDLCRGENWPADDIVTASDEPNEIYNSLHEYVAVQMGKAFSRYAQIAHRKDDTPLALHLLQEAIKAISEVTRLSNYILLIETCFCKIRYLFSVGHYQAAYDDLIIIEKKYMSELTGDDFGRMNCEFLLLKAQVENELQKKNMVALEKFKMALAVSRQHTVKTIEAQALLQMGKLYMKYRVHQDKARYVFAQSKIVFNQILDTSSRKIALYNLAEITARQHFNELKKIIIESQFDFCSLHKLRKWKDRCVPFWEEFTLTGLGDSFDNLSNQLSMVSHNKSMLHVSLTRLQNERQFNCLFHEKLL